MYIETPYRPLRMMSSPIDWCEPNHQVSNFIVEFANTVSNLPLLLFPVVQFFKMSQRDLPFMNHGLKYVLLLIHLTSYGSAYFHATLSLAGQIIDELGILWVICVLSGLYWPRNLLPYGFKPRNMMEISVCVASFLSIATTCTVLSGVYPALVQYALIVVGAPFTLAIVNDFIHSRVTLESHCSKTVYESVFLRFVCIFAAAFTIWALDKAMCDLWLRWKVPYLHAVWHVMTAYGASYGIMFSVYDDFRKSHLDGQLKVEYFPQKLTFLGIPYFRLIM